MTTDHWVVACPQPSKIYSVTTLKGVKLGDPGPKMKITPAGILLFLKATEQRPPT